MIEIAGYSLAFVMGSTLGLIGAGGSILTVPILVYFLGVNPVTATGYSLLVVGLTALVGAYRYHHKGQIDYHTALIFAAPALVAVYLSRALIVPWIPDPVIGIGKDMFIMLLFAALMVVSGVMMINNGQNAKPHETHSLSKKILIVGAEGIIVGILTGIVGAGGGFLIIPALVLVMGLDMKLAVGSSLLIIAIKSLFGFIGDIQAGISMDYQMIGLFLAATISGMFFGVMMSKKISAHGLRKMFGIFTLVVAAVVIFKEFNIGG